MDVVIAELGTRRFAVELMEVQQVLRLGPVTPVPAAPAVVIGVMNAQGSILPIVDLGLLLGEGSSQPSLGDSGLLVRCGDGHAVLYAGRIHEVARLRSSKRLGGGRDEALSEVIGTEQGSLHLVDVAGVLKVASRRVDEQAQWLMAPDASPPEGVTAG